MATEKTAPGTEVDLEARGGGHVARVRIPPFDPQPEAILWSQRVFVQRPDGRYEEGLLWPVIENPPYGTMGRGAQADAAPADGDADG